MISRFLLIAALLASIATASHLGAVPQEDENQPAACDNSGAKGHRASQSPLRLRARRAGPLRCRRRKEPQISVQNLLPPRRLRLRWTLCTVLTIAGCAARPSSTDRPCAQTDGCWMRQPCPITSGWCWCRRDDAGLGLCARVVSPTMRHYEVLYRYLNWTRFQRMSCWPCWRPPKPTATATTS